MFKEINHERAVYYPPYDYAAGMFVERITKVLLNDIFGTININDAIEYYQAKLTIDNYPEFFDPASFDELSKRSKNYYSKACRFINNQLKANRLLDIMAETELQYSSGLIDLIATSNAYKQISQNEMEEALDAHPNIIKRVLAHKSLAASFSNAIKHFLLANPIFAAKFLIGEFGAERKNSERLVAPKNLDNDEIDSIMLEYLGQQQPNLNYISVLRNWPIGKTPLNYSPGPEVQVLAKKKAIQLNSEVVANSFSIHHKIEMVFNDSQKACKNIRIADDGFSLSYSSQWLSKYTDNGTILNNLIYVFDFVDSTGLLRIPAHKHEQSTLLSAIGLHAIGEYPASIQFQQRNQIAVGVIHLYRLFLENTGQNRLESAIEWAFNDYAKSEFGIDGFTISLPTKETSYLDKCKAIGPEIERITKAFLLLSSKGKIDEDYFTCISIKSFADVKSLVRHKYVEAGPQFEEHASLLFSDQSCLAFSENHKNAKQQFCAMIVEETAKREDFPNIYQPAIDKLLEDGTLEINEEGVLRPTKKAAILKLVWEKGAIEICKYHDQDKALAKDLVDLGWLVYSDSLFTSDESAYLNYMFNNAEFCNSIALRNKYDHGTFRVNDPNAEEYASDYDNLLSLLISIMLKIFDDLSLRYGAGGVEDFVDWPLVDESVVSVANQMLQSDFDLDRS